MPVVSVVFCKIHRASSVPTISASYVLWSSLVPRYFCSNLRGQAEFLQKSIAVAPMLLFWQELSEYILKSLSLFASDSIDFVLDSSIVVMGRSFLGRR